MTYVVTADRHTGLQMDGNSLLATAALTQAPLTFSWDQLFVFESNVASALSVRAYHSGLLLHATANGRIEQTAAADTTSQWHIAALNANTYVVEHVASGMCLQLLDDTQAVQLVPLKKGWAGWNSQWPKVQATFHTTWYYDWGSGGQKDVPAGSEYVPMVWGYWGDAKGLQAYLQSAAADPNVKHMLGYNEPDNAGQANLDVHTAIATWPWFEAMNKPLGSPAGTQATGAWMQTFMQGVGDPNVAFVTVHWYGGTNADSLKSYLDNVWNTYHRPVWITEFCPADWGAGSVDKINFSQQNVTDFMARILPMLDSLPYVQRYSWFEAGTNDGALGHSTLRNADSSLTGAGQLYANYPFVP